MRGKLLLATQNDAGTVGPVLQEIADAVGVLGRDGVWLDVLIVDAASSDGTVDRAVRTAEVAGLTLDVVKAPDGNEVAGLADAIGLATSDPSVSLIALVDAGGRHDARQLPDLVRAHIARENGITIGSRWTRGGTSPGTTARRSLVSRAGNVAVRVVGGLRGVSDATSGFRVLDPEVARLVPPAAAMVESACYHACVAALAQAEGYAIDEIPIEFRPRYSPVTRLSWRDLVSFSRGLWATRGDARRRRALRNEDQTEWAKRQRHFNPQEPAADSYFGAMDELVQLSDANRFFGWIVDEFGAAVGPRTLEVGAGLGTVSRMIAERHPEVSVLALEPAANVFPGLADTASAHPRIEARQTTSGALLAAGANSSFDSVIYVNVMEHIEDDRGELGVARELLTDGGHLCVFVPAMPFLYSKIDHKSGHFRRYTKPALVQKVQAAGFEIERVDYFDVASVFPYWLMYRVLGVENLSGGSNTFYDKVIVPVSQILQKVLRHPPLGKNLILVARKSVS